MGALHKRIDAYLHHAGAFRRRLGRPLVSLCYAQSLDGSITARRGQPTALSGPASGRFTHQLRGAHDAILVGVGTVLADDPRLTVRLAPGNNPQPIILDGRLRTNTDSYLLREHPHKPWIATTQEMHTPQADALKNAGARLMVLPADQNGRVHLPALLERLGAEGINSLMVEGGAQVIASFLKQRQADQLVLTVAPLFLGGLQIGMEDFSLAGAHPDAAFPQLDEVHYEQLGDDLIVWGKIVYGGRNG